MLPRDGAICQICELPIDLPAHSADDLAVNIDHFDPVEDGGSDDIENLRATHRWRNNERHGNPWWSLDHQIREDARIRFAHLL